MWSDGIVLLPPAFHNDPCFQDCIKDLSVQEFVPKFSVERFDIAVLPWTSRFNEQRLNSQPAQPSTRDLCNKLRTVVGTKMRWRSVYEKQIRQLLHHIVGRDLPRHVRQQTLAREIIDRGGVRGGEW